MARVNMRMKLEMKMILMRRNVGPRMLTMTNVISDMLSTLVIIV